MLDGPPSSSARPPAWAWVAVAAALGLAAAVLVHAIATGDDGRFADEGYYVDYARFVAQRGLAGFPQLFERYLGDSQHWHFPNPLRLGYLAAGAAATALADDPFAALRGLSVAGHLGAVAVAWRLARRALGELDAVLAAWCVAFSPLLLFLGQRAMTESFTLLWTLLAALGFLHAARRPDALRLVLAGAAWAAAMLSRETSVLLALPFAACAGVAARRGGRGVAARLAALLVVPPLLVGLLQAWAAGGPSNLARMARIVVESPATNEYARMYGSGPWYQYAVDLVALAPWVALLAVAGAAYAARDGAEPGSRAESRRFVLAVAAGSWIAFALFTKNVRYVAAVDALLRVLAVAALAELARPLPARAGAVVRCAVVIALCAGGVHTLHDVFLDRPLNDTTSTWILGGRRIVPLAD